MKLKILKGVAHDPANHLAFQIWFGKPKHLKKGMNTSILAGKISLYKSCISTMG